MEQTTIKETELNTPIDDRLARAKELGAINDKGEINEPLYAKRSQ
jgi:hypothetical protein